MYACTIRGISTLAYIVLPFLVSTKLEFFEYATVIDQQTKSKEDSRSFVLSDLKLGQRLLAVVSERFVHMSQSAAFAGFWSSLPTPLTPWV